MVKKIIFLSLGFYCAASAMDRIFEDEKYKALERQIDLVDRVNACCFLGSCICCSATTDTCQTLCLKIGVQPETIAPLGWQAALTTLLCGLVGTGYSGYLEQKQTARIEKLIAMTHARTQKEREEKSR